MEWNGMAQKYGLFSKRNWPGSNFANYTYCRTEKPKCPALSGNYTFLDFKVYIHFLLEHLPSGDEAKSISERGGIEQQHGIH